MECNQTMRNAKQFPETTLANNDKFLFMNHLNTYWVHAIKRDRKKVLTLDGSTLALNFVDPNNFL